MTSLLQRPILVGGLGLTFSVWLLDQFVPVVPDFAGTALWLAIALGSGFWVFQKRSKKIDLTPLTFSVDRSKAEKALAAVDAHISRLAQETAPESEPVMTLRKQLAQLTTEIDRQEVRTAIMGGKSVGKTTLAKLLPGVAIEGTDSLEDVVGADVVMFLATGDLTDSEFQTVQGLMAQNHRVILALNKQDQYLPGDRPVILQQFHEKMQEILRIEDIVAIATQPAAFKVRQYQPDGSVQERLEQPGADIAPLQERLNQILAQQSQSLIFATSYRQAQALNAQVKDEFNKIRRDRAQPIVEQYQWVAAAAAFANPVPSLDLLATTTINTQMVMDLGAVYQQKFSLDQAKTVTATLASQMIKLGLVELSTQAIAPLLKSNVLTYVAGGTLQGLSAAHLTQVAGLSLVEYFEEQVQSLEPGAEARFQPASLVQKLQAVFQENQRTAFLQTLVSQGMNRLVPAS
ncbi:MAG: DUF697 domain-containing protein [Timaviella obliquedivisa GSE-PSE-MK23-08B]|jgi:hypothetical protein|nr:DUF697 domain-containing protein [Timaviella obliquedivisa GSE-PSE-MK23-08B]